MTVSLDEDRRDHIVEPGQLRAYLSSAGWALVSADTAAELWELPSVGGRGQQILVPFNSSYVDFDRRLRESIQQLCDLYDWDVERLVASVRAVRSDLLLIRADQLTRFDSIPLRQAEQLISGTLGMLTAAAWSTVSPKPSFAGRHPNIVKQFVGDDVRMGHTQRGSFIITVYTTIEDEPVEVREDQPIAGDEDAAPAFKPTAQPLQAAGPSVTEGAEDTSVKLAPFQRRVMATLATGLQEAREITRRPLYVRRVEESAARGVSAQLCESLLEMTKFEGLRSLGMSFQWAALAAIPTPTISGVLIDRDTIGELEGVRDRFKAREERPPRVSIYGRVMRLERTQSQGASHDPNEEEAVATLLGVEGRNVRRQVRVEVSGEQHSIAIRSYDLQGAITVSGELHREGSRYWLRGDVEVVE